MLIRRKRLFWFGAGILAVGAAFLVFPPYTAYCEGENANDNYCSVYEMAVAISTFVETHSGSFTALATIAIAWFTLTLKRSTDKLWTAGERQLRHAKSEAFSAQSDRWREHLQTRDQIEILKTSSNAAQDAAVASVQQAKIAEDTLTKIQRPYVFIYDVIGILPGITEHLDGHVPYTVANLGQTPAIIDGIEARISKGDIPLEPGQETEDHPLVTAPILAPQERRPNIRVQSTFWIRGILLLPDIHDPKAHTYVSANIERGENLFVRLRIRYRSATTDGYETSGCWRYDQAYGLFVRYGGDEYNYAT